jgi:hypothetical protein
MIKKVAIAFAITSIIAFALANEPQLVIDPITKQIYVTTGSATNTPIFQEQSTGNTLNFADTFIPSTGTQNTSNT